MENPSMLEVLPLVEGIQPPQPMSGDTPVERTVAKEVKTSIPLEVVRALAVAEGTPVGAVETVVDPNTSAAEEEEGGIQPEEEEAMVREVWSKHKEGSPCTAQEGSAQDSREGESAPPVEVDLVKSPLPVAESPSANPEEIYDEGNSRSSWP